MASELCKRGHEVAFTLGHNTPLADLIVISPKKRHFLIDVKGLSTKNAWIVKRKKPRRELFYVLALVPKGHPNKFFIMAQRDANKLITENFNRPSKRKKPGWDGFLYNAAIKFHERWDLLPK